MTFLETLPAPITLRDYARFYVNATLQRQWFQTFVKLVVVLGICGGLTFEFFVNTPARDHWIGWLPVGFSAYAVLKQFLISPGLAVLRESRRPYVPLPRIYRIDRRGLRQHLGISGMEMEWDKTKTIDWDQVEDIVNTGGTLLLYTSRFEAAIIPKTAFADDEACADFFRAAQNWHLATYEVSPSVESFRSEKQAEL